MKDTTLENEVDPAAPETLVYKLVANICVITEIHIHPFQAYFLFGFPIYSVKAVRFWLGHLRPAYEFDNDINYESSPALKFISENFVWAYASPSFPMAQGSPGLLCLYEDFVDHIIRRSGIRAQQDSIMGDRGVRMHRHPRRNADRGNEDYRRHPRDIEEIARLQQRVWDLELQQEIRSGDETETDSPICDDEENNYNSFAHEDRWNSCERREQRADPLRNFGVKFDIPEFDGRAEPDVFLDWLQTVERVFDLRDIPENYKVKLVEIKLRKYASLWWEHVKKRRVQEERSKVKTWDKMKKLLREKFLPPNFRQEAFLEYHNISQRSTTVEEFICEFDRLRMRCGVEEEEEQVITRFFGALKPEIADII